MADPIPSAGAVILDGRDRIVLVRRGRPPQQGRWSIPGGKWEPGETISETVVREVREETGLEVEVERELGREMLPAGGGHYFDNVDFLVRVVGGTLKAGDDADEAGWFALDELDSGLLTDDLLGYLDAYGVVQRRGDL